MSTLLAEPAARAVTETRPPACSSRLKWGLRLLAVAFAGLQAWGGRFAINPDGVSYLDIADAYLRGDWHNAVSTYWSPLYSWLLAVGLALWPSPYWEFPVAKAVNFVVFLAALAAFEWFAHEAIWRPRERPREPLETMALPRAVLFAFAYVLFLWSSCVMTSLALLTPDLLVSLFVYLMAAWVLRARRVSPGVGMSALFGLMLGAGCLAKSALLPLGLLFLFTSLFAVGSPRKAAVHLAAAAAVMAVVFGSFVGAMYEKSGRLTLGDVSRLNYLWLVNGVPDHGWESDDPRLGTAVHPPRRLPSEPAVFEFADPIPGTFPLWYDPSYWCEGLSWRFDFRQQLSAIAANLHEYYYLFSSDVLPFTAAAVLLHVGAWLASTGSVRDRLRVRLRALADDYPLLIPSLGACGLYGLVVVEPRYLTGFIVLLGVAVARAVVFPRDNAAEMRRWGWTVIMVVVLAPAVWLALRQGARAVGRGESGVNVSWQVAEALHRQGVAPGATVGNIGSAFDAGWARTGRFHIGAEVRSRDAARFWAEDAAKQEEVFVAFRQAGAAAVVARDVPESEHGWERIQGTDYAVRVLTGTEDANLQHKRSR